MISKRDITKIAKQILKRQKGLRDHQIIHPVREWFTGLAFGLLVVVVGGIWSFVTYNEISDRDVDSSGAGEITQNVYRGEMVDTALDLFRDRKNAFAELSGTASVYLPTAEEEATESELEESEQEIDIESVEVMEETSDVEPTSEDESEESSEPAAAVELDIN